MTIRIWENKKMLQVLHLKGSRAISVGDTLVHVEHVPDDRVAALVHDLDGLVDVSGWLEELDVVPGKRDRFNQKYQVTWKRQNSLAYCV